MSDTQTAVLTRRDGTSREISVAAFPDNPEVINSDDGIFVADSPVVGYGTTTLAYHEATVLNDVGKGPGTFA